MLRTRTFGLVGCLLAGALALLPSDAGATGQAPVLIPFAADAVQTAMLMTQFLRELAVAMPGALNLVKLTIHRSRCSVNSATAIIKPFCFELRHNAPCFGRSGITFKPADTGVLNPPVARPIISKCASPYLVSNPKFSWFKGVVNRFSGYKIWCFLTCQKFDFVLR